MKIRAMYFWMGAVIVFLVALVLPMASFESPSGSIFQIRGFSGVRSLFSQVLTQAALILGSSSLGMPSFWLISLPYGIGFVLVIVSPFFLFTNALNAQRRLGAFLCFGQIAVFAAAFVGLIFLSKEAGLELQFPAFLVLGIGVLLLCVSYFLKNKERNQPCDALEVPSGASSGPQASRLRCAIAAVLVSLASLVIMLFLFSGPMYFLSMLRGGSPQIAIISAMAGVVRLPFKKGGLVLSVVCGIVVAILGFLVVLCIALSRK